MHLQNLNTPIAKTIAGGLCDLSRKNKRQTLINYKGLAKEAPSPIITAHKNVKGTGQIRKICIEFQLIADNGKEGVVLIIAAISCHQGIAVVGVIGIRSGECPHYGTNGVALVKKAVRERNVGRRCIVKTPEIFFF